MKEVLTIQVSTWQMIEVKGKTAEAGMILFDGFCDCENFKGRILPGGVDTQKSFYPEARSLSARYILEGTDINGKECRIFIENNGTADKEGRIEYTKPKIITDSESLGWMETADLTGTITPWDKGVMIHIFVN